MSENETPYRGAAGGLPAVASTMRFALGKAGLLAGTRALLRVNQQGGFDCPGCAWPEPEHRSVAEFCENGAKAVADEATTRRCDPSFFAEWSVAALAEQSDPWLNAQGRLTHPMVLRPGRAHYAPIDWPEAFALVAEELRALASPDEAVFYTSGRTSNEAAFLYQLMVRLFGTNNLPDCSNMCHESSGVGLTQAIGVGKGTVQLSDFEQADCIFVIGQNPGTNHPRILSTLQAAARRGCAIVAVNPLREAGLLRFKHPQELTGLVGPGTPLATHFFQVRINGDVAFLKGVMKELLLREREQLGSAFDHEFLRAYTTGVGALLADLDATPWEAITASSGLTREEIASAAELVLRSRNIIVCWAMGLTQHKNGVGNIQSIVNLLALRGSLGRPGAGLCPVRGHSNVQGDRTMGIVERPSEEFLRALGEAVGFAPPRRHGLDTVQAIRAMRDGVAKLFFAMGGNFLSATPDTPVTAEALRRCRLTAHVATKLNRAHLVTGETALILPCLGRTERDVQAGGPQLVSVENSMGIVHASRGVARPASEHLKSEPRIVAELARALFGPRGLAHHARWDAAAGLDWEGLTDDYDRVRELIERVVPGFERYNERVREPNGFILPNDARERRFRTKSRSVELTVHPIPTLELAPDQWLMMTVRSHDQYNTTIYDLDDRYRGVRGARDVLFMREDELRAAGFAPGDRVDVTSHFRGERRVLAGLVLTPYALPRRCAASYFPEANVLVPLDSVADGSNTPTSKSVVISIAPAGSAAVQA